MKKPYAIIIMDGYGLSGEKNGNAIAMEGSPNVEKYRREYPSGELGASGMSVGLPDGQMGNSEVGTSTWARAHRLSGTDQDHQRDRGRRLFQKRSAARRDGKRKEKS